MDWSGKPSKGIRKHGIVKHGLIKQIYDQLIKKGFFLGFIGSENCKHDLGTVMFQ